MDVLFEELKGDVQLGTSTEYRRRNIHYSPRTSMEFLAPPESRKEWCVIILGIETSCDETGVAIVRNGNELLANVVATSMDEHVKYGGIVPEVAARAQLEYMTPTLEKAMKQAGCNWDDIDAIAVTNGPGLGGSLLVGVMTAKTLADLKNKPLFPINHVHAHVAVNLLTSTKLDYELPNESPKFPLIALIVSGGHTQLVYFKTLLDYEVIGKTLDDAVGEAFDKVAKILGLPYPGGPSVARLAKQGDPTKYKLPISRLDNPYDFSFSGLKTAVLRLAQEVVGEDYRFPSHLLSSRLTDQQKADISASFESVAIDTLVEKTLLACDKLDCTRILLAGGVAANTQLRQKFEQKDSIELLTTDIKLCTDNGAMVATLGVEKITQNVPPTEPEKVQIIPSLKM